MDPQQSPYAERPSYVTIFVLITLSIMVVLYSGCRKSDQAGAAAEKPSEEVFREYWFQGLAEITRFELDQARYNEIHKGDAVLIYVTEEFFKEKQVKSESGKQPNAVSILKLNLSRKFNTGIYPYSMMSSIFTPIKRKAFPRTLKVTTSVQEWCGQTYIQLNLKEDLYHVLLRSYFMDEGDRELMVENAQLEDDVWTLIRLNPELLPTGPIRMIPGSQYCRLKHIQPKGEFVTASLDEVGDHYSYSIVYKDLPRRLSILFKKKFPYEIMGWQETTGDRNKDNELLVTRAVRTHMLRIDYWNKNAVHDVLLRQELGLH